SVLAGPVERVDDPGAERVEPARIVPLGPGRLLRQHGVVGSEEPQAIDEQAVSGGVATVAQVPWIGGGCPGGRIVLHRQQQVAGLAGEIMGESMIVLGRHGRARYRSFEASWSRPILDLNGRVF